ncbi:putative FBD-associated F-box protein At5g56700 [Dioscorea cayenensis subsp. rotundata]|uniref:FBD-associated F-box protein At5g56700 n=1 Tax=Dioscorea cayennensis subsp. rotundata TaxID=55577 RepID=A0AB40BVZ5_DIOCR|nr:putative FBD-associated F-box protein At5g56700 [Dioscorea cayenensis subsp. rotundata]
MNKAFADFVNKALVIHKGQCIQRFYLQLEGYRARLPYVCCWIRFAVNHFVQELELCIPEMTLDYLPERFVFTCESLRLLKLDLPGYVLKLRRTVTLINVRTLYLKSMSFRDDKVIHKLISGCPKLENLGMNNCSMYGMKILNICSLELQNLSLIDCQIYSSCEVNISVPKLQSFRYHCPLTVAGSNYVEFKNVVTTVPMCPLFNLKTVNLRNVVGVNKLDLVGFLVKNAEVLEKIVTISAEGVAKEIVLEGIKGHA